MQAIARKNLKLKSCPRCGGDVCRMRDTFGVYHQCAQCGRDIRNMAPTAGETDVLTAMPPHTNSADHREKVLA